MMKIIVFEGLDKSGKYSQSQKLYEHFKQEGFMVEKSEFHRYDTPTGKLIMDWLTGKWDVDQHTIELIMSADKQAQQAWFAQLEEQGVDYLILDRYTGSQSCYSLANDIPMNWADALQTFMRKPDIEILLDIPAQMSMERKGKHNDGENDRYESDLHLLEFVRLLYQQRDNIQIDGTQDMDKVHQDVLTALEERIPVYSSYASQLRR